VESGRPADAPEAAVRERSEERDVASAGERPKAVEATEERAQELRQRWDTTEKVEARGTTEAVRESEARERPERGPRAPVERERSSVREEAPAAEVPTGFVRRRKRRETRPHVYSDRTAGKARKELQPEGSAAGDAPAVQVPSGDIRTGEVPSGGPSAGDAGAEHGRSEHVRTEEDVRAEDARTEDARTEDVRTEDVPTGGRTEDRTEDRTGAAPSGDAGDAGGPPVPDPGDSVKTTAEPGGSADSGFTRRKKRHVRGLRRR